MSNKNIYQKLIEVSKAIEYLEKDKSNKMQGYKYLSEAKVKEVIKKQFEEHGILFNYSTYEIREYEISPTHKGTKQYTTIARGNYQFINIDNSEEKIVGNWAGSGSDTGDKGLYKAITGGIKYVLNTNFLIPTGDDPENDVNNDKPTNKSANKPVNSKEIKDLLDLAFTSERTREAFMKSFKGTDEELKKVLNERVKKEVGV